MPDKSPNSEFSYCEFESDNHGEGVMMPQNHITEHQRESSPPAHDENKSQASPPSSSMGMEQKPAESTSTIDQSESKEVLDLLNQDEISDTPTTPTIPVIDLYSFMPTPSNRKDMANIVSQAREICDYYQPILNNLYSNIEQFGYCLSFQIYMEFAKFIEEVQKRMETWSDVLQQMAPFANCDSQQQIEDMLQEIKQLFEQFSNSNLFASIRQKCHTAEWFRGLAVPFVGRAGMEMDLATALASSSQKSQYVFFHNSLVPPGPNTNECIELFYQSIGKGERCIYVDTSLATVPSNIPDGDRIAKFFMTELVSTDYVQEDVRKMYTCIVRMEGAISSSNQSVKDTQKNEQFPLEIPCPKAAIYGGACSNGGCLWECDDCGKLIYIRKPSKGDTRADHFHCDCGQVPLTGAKFRCKDVDLHGYDEFIEFPLDKLADQLHLHAVAEDEPSSSTSSKDSP